MIRSPFGPAKKKGLQGSLNPKTLTLNPPNPKPETLTLKLRIVSG